VVGNPRRNALFGAVPETRGLHIGPSRTVKRSLWLIDVGLAYDVAYVFETDAARGKRLRIDLNSDGKPLPDWGHVHAELRRRGVTLALLWEESQT